MASVRDVGLSIIAPGPNFTSKMFFAAKPVTRQEANAMGLLQDCVLNVTLSKSRERWHVHARANVRWLA